MIDKTFASYKLLDMYLRKFKTTLPEVIATVKLEKENATVEDVVRKIQTFVLTEKKYIAFFHEAKVKLFRTGMDTEFEVFNFMYDFIPLPR